MKKRRLRHRSCPSGLLLQLWHLLHYQLMEGRVYQHSLPLCSLSRARPLPCRVNLLQQLLLPSPEWLDLPSLPYGSLARFSQTLWVGSSFLLLQLA